MEKIREFFDSVKAWFTEGDSPKGRFRLENTACIAIVALVGVYFVDSFILDGWFRQMFLQMAKAALMSCVFYWVVQREVLHNRTHELTDEQRAVRENYLLIAHAVVIGCSVAI